MPQPRHSLCALKPSRAGNVHGFSLVTTVSVVTANPALCAGGYIRPHDGTQSVTASVPTQERGNESRSACHPERIFH